VAPTVNVPLSRLGRLEFVGLALLAGAVAWTLIVGFLRDANPWPLVGILTGSVAALVLADRATRRTGLAVPLGLALLPLVAAVGARQSLLNDGALGYANASGALYLIAAAAAVMLGLRATTGRGRRAAAVLAAFWAVLVLLVNAQTAAVFAGLLAVALFVLSARAVRVAVVAGGAATLLTLAAAITLGLGYVWWLRTDVLFHAVDSTLGQVRVALWHDALEQITARPLVGVGPGQFRADSVALDDWAATVHNEVLQVTAETGLIGGVLVLALLGWVFVLLWSAPLDGSALPAVIALTGIAVQANIDFTWHFPLVPIAGAALVGSALGYRSHADPPPTPIARRHPAASVTVAYAVVLTAMLLWPGGNLNPPYTEPNAVEWASDGLRFVDDGVVYSRSAPEELYRRLTADTGLSVEVWAATAGLDQTGPARLVSSSGEVLHRNFTLGQERDVLVVRLRTTETTLNGVPPAARVRGVFDDTELRHLVFTHDSDRVHVWVDGEAETSVPSPGGTFAKWIFSYPLLLGNEGDGQRPWHGRLAAVALYDRPLTAAEVRERFLAGPGAADQIGDAVAWYAFAAGDSGDLSDRSAAGLGPELVIPERREAVPQGFVPTVLDMEHALRFAAADPDGRVGPAVAVRVLGHVILFAVLAGLVVRAVPDRWRSIGVALALAAPVAFAAVISVVRFTAGRSASVMDVVAAALGGLLGVGLAVAWRHLRSRTSEDHGARQGAAPAH
jgi:hypothetical protein